MEKDEIKFLFLKDFWDVFIMRFDLIYVYIECDKLGKMNLSYGDFEEVFVDLICYMDVVKRFDLLFYFFKFKKRR